MTAESNLERRIAEHYAGEPPLRAPDRVLLAALATIDTTPQRRGIFAPWRFTTMPLYARVAILVALLAIGAVGLALVGFSTPRPVTEPLVWSPARYAADWPAAPRTEPAGGAPDILLVRGDDAHWDPGERAWEGLEYVDPAGDVGTDAVPWIDIREIRGSLAGIDSYTIELAGGVPLPATDPRARWVAYGVVIDVDGDGTADERVGIDNMPDGSHRAWATDLRTGQTKWKAGPGYGWIHDDGVDAGTLGLDTWYPSVREETDDAVFRYSGGSGRFYAWASMIEGGQLVATDYAPDAGWLVAPDDEGLPLIGTTWTIERELSDSLSVVMWLVFAEGGRLELELCRHGQATAQVAEDTMRVTDVVLAGDGCSPEIEDMETEILAVLSADDLSYSVNAGELELSAGSNVLRFTGSPDPPVRF